MILMSLTSQHSIAVATTAAAAAEAVEVVKEAKTEKKKKTFPQNFHLSLPPPFTSSKLNADKENKIVYEIKASGREREREREREKEKKPVDSANTKLSE
jgi:hypothetical protein